MLLIKSFKKYMKLSIEKISLKKIIINFCLNVINKKF